MLLRVKLKLVAAFSCSGVFVVLRGVLQGFFEGFFAGSSRVVRGFLGGSSLAGSSGLLGYWVAGKLRKLCGT